MLLLAHTVTSVAFGCSSPSGPLPCPPLSLTKPRGALGEVSEVSAPDADSGTGDLLSEVFPPALLEGGQLAGASGLPDPCLLPTSLVLEDPGLGKAAEGSTVPGHVPGSDASQTSTGVSASPTALRPPASGGSRGGALWQERASCPAWLLTVPGAAAAWEGSRGGSGEQGAGPSRRSCWSLRVTS